MARTILIIEDEPNLVELIKFRLEAGGYKVETAEDGGEGLKKIKALKPDLVILDVMIPGIDGYEVCRLSKEGAATKEIPVLVLTAYAQKEDLEKARKSGADAYMSKPFESEELMGRIAKLIRK